MVNEKTWKWPSQTKTYKERQAFCVRIFRVARQSAQRQGFIGEAADECALEFFEQMLLRRTWQAVYPQGTSLSASASDAWLRRCADNFAKNLRRSVKRTRDWEGNWPNRIDMDGERQDWDIPDRTLSPETILLQRELVVRILRATEQLTTPQQNLFERHYIDGEPVAVLAANTGQTPHAISQSLFNIRRRLRSILERQGLDEQTAREYLHIAVYDNDNHFMQTK